MTTLSFFARTAYGSDDEKSDPSLDYAQHYSNIFKEARFLSAFTKYDPRNDTLQTSARFPLLPSTISRATFYSRLMTLLENFTNKDTAVLLSISVHFRREFPNEVTPVLTQLKAIVRELLVAKPPPANHPVFTSFDVFGLDSARENGSNSGTALSSRRGNQTVRRGSRLLPTFSSELAEECVDRLFGPMKRVCTGKFDDVENIDPLHQKRCAAIVKLIANQHLTDAEIEDLQIANNTKQPLANSARSAKSSSASSSPSALPLHLASSLTRINSYPFSSRRSGQSSSSFGLFSARTTNSSFCALSSARSISSSASPFENWRKSSARLRATTPTLGESARSTERPTFSANGFTSHRGNDLSARARKLSLAIPHLPDPAPQAF